MHNGSRFNPMKGIEVKKIEVKYFPFLIYTNTLFIKYNKIVSFLRNMFSYSKLYMQLFMK